MNSFKVLLVICALAALAGSASARCFDGDRDGDCDLRRDEARRLASQVTRQFRKDHCRGGVCVMREGEFRTLREAIANLLLEVDERAEY